MFSKKNEKKKKKPGDYKIWIDRLGIIIVILIFLVCLYVLLFRK